MLFLLYCTLYEIFALHKQILNILFRIQFLNVIFSIGGHYDFKDLSLKTVNDKNKTVTLTK